jgi:isopentenyl-diphosphate delta-isomerase type 1
MRRLQASPYNARDQVILVNTEDQPVGVMGKQEAHLTASLHRAISVFVFRFKPTGEWELLLQQRADHKYHCGGLWTNTCCSHPQPEEDTGAAAESRLFEELGLSLRLQPAGHFIYRAAFSNGLTEHEFDHVFVGLVSEAPTLHVDPNEVQSVQWISETRLHQQLAETPEVFTPWFSKALVIALEGLSQTGVI